MQTLRIISTQIIDSSTIDVKFTEILTPNLATSNVSIITDTPNVPSSQVLKVIVNQDILTITCQPLTPFAAYFLQFQSVTLHPFISLHGDAKISEDGVSNRFLITGPLDADNPVKNYLEAFLKDNIYTLDDSSVVGQYIKSIATTFSKALYDIRQVKNENYLSVTITDERKIRGSGPFDRLNEEGAYEIIRVGQGPSTANANTTFIFDDFPTFPVTLQRVQITETLQAGSLDHVGLFNIDDLIFNLQHSPVTKVNSIIFILETVNPVFVYDIEKLGYQLLDSRYDQDFGFTQLQLADNQIKINEQILSDPNFALDKILRIEIQYEYKNLGRIIDTNSLLVYTVLTSIREALPPIINVFNLAHAPIVDSNNETPILGGIVFLDPNNLPGSLHPAFLVEIPFRLNALPSAPGQYSIDYNSGTVYVYGASQSNDGTGPYPPLATYQYRFVYKSEVDYVYDSDASDIVALPLGNLIDSPGNINFNYEEVLVPGVDFVPGLHQEVLTERIGNNLVALNALKVKRSPVTNVFRIFNETTGEIFSLNRWNNDKIYFRYNTPPHIIELTNERITFKNILNELLFVNNTTTNTSSLRVFKILLNNNFITNSTEDGLGTSFNSSLTFEKSSIFKTELWFNRDFSEIANTNRLLNVGEYTVDYINGIVYCAVSNTQDFNLGTASYKNNIIIPQFPHLISVEDIYYRFSVLTPKEKTFSYTDFEDGLIIPEILDVSDQSFLNDNESAPYQLFNGKIGAFIGSDFVPGVTNQIKFLRSVFEYNDLLHSANPLNFASVSSSSGFNINVNSIQQQIFGSVQFDGTNYFVLLDRNIPYLSTNITYTFSVVRISDSAPLWDGSGVIVPGNPLKLILSGTNSPVVGDLVNISYTFTINNLSRVIVDYNKGDLFVDYTYLADEIIVSYEYGDNVLDFRQNTNLPTNSQYFVTYKVGALRDALLKNFGSLVNIPELSNFDIDFDRERYREALMAALSSFIQGPTVTAIKNIGKTISHIEPEVIESAFGGWSLGSSLLEPEAISTTGDFQLMPAKFGNGVLINNDNQTIKMPVSSNLRLEEGTFENWIAPQWNGIDNDAILTFNITLDGYPVTPTDVFIGANEHHPEIINGSFTLDKNLQISGKPNKNKDGIFIYYDKDISGNFSRWFVEVSDGYVDGYHDGYVDGYVDLHRTYKFKISSNGLFYDVKSINNPKPSNLNIFTGTNTINLTITGGTGDIDEGITFISDVEHYLLDFGKDVNKNRMSIFKDVSGYLNFRVFDKNKTSYVISADVSSWRAGDLHHIATSWKLNTRNNRDELHLFIDGLEVPNIIKYGQNLLPFLHEKFRTVDPEEVVGLSNRDIVGSIDLVTTSGSNVVTSSIDFSSFNIFVGDTIFIDEVGFSSSGYTIINVNGQTLTLNQSMPISLTSGRYSVNRTEYTILSDIDVAPNIAVSVIHSLINGSDLSGSIGTSTVVSAGSNFTTLGILPGYLLRVDDPSLATSYVITQVSGNSLTINGILTVNLTNATFHVYSDVETELPGVRAVHPDYSISKDSNFNNVLTISNGVIANDLILIRTLGLNHRKVTKRYYVWSDDVENILMTRLPPPISLDEANIIRVILPSVAIGPGNSILSSGIFNYTNSSISQPSNSQNGRTLQIRLAGTNVDFSTPTAVNINGIIFGGGTITETVSFSDYGILDTANMFISINSISVSTKPINSSKNAAAVEVKEKYSITHSEQSGLVPVIRFSYPIGAGYTLHSDGYNSVRDDNNIFSGLDINNYLVIQSPLSVAGFYIITGLSADRKSLFVEPTNAATSLPIPNFTGGVYQVLYVNAARSGLQNGFFTFEDKLLPGQAYFLRNGFYDLVYSTYISAEFDPLNTDLFLGSDFNGHNQLNGIMDQVKIYSIMLTDTRVGETIPTNQHSITKDFNSLKPLKKNRATLVLINFDQLPFTNAADFYITPTSVPRHFQSSIVVNENFGDSIVLLDQPIVINNDGILDTKKEGTIEFWTSPIFDTGNDPNTRFYFDAFGAVIEEMTSVNNVSVKISSSASQILSVTLKAGDPSIDYFAGGKLEIDTQNAITEEAVSLNANTVTTAQAILQVISVKIVDDFTEVDYFADGRIGADHRTIYLSKTLPFNNTPVIITYQSSDTNSQKFNTQIIRLNKKLPDQNSRVVVTYLPKGVQGDRLSIFKDEFGYVNFSIFASGTDFTLRAPTRWAKDSWHRVRASYKINGGQNNDEMRLFIDGYEYTDVLFGSGILFGGFPFVAGAVSVGDGYGIVNNIAFKDPINTLFIGSQYSHASPLFGLIDNFRISNISRTLLAPYGEAIDINFNNNISAAIPVTVDLFTTLLLNFDTMAKLNEDFTVLSDPKLFDFTVNLFNSFDILDNTKVRAVLEKLIRILKPAGSRAFINYINGT